MYKYEEVEENYKIIKKFVMEYRKELTVLQGVFCEVNNIMLCSDYVKFMNKLSCDENVGNLLTSLFQSDTTKIYKQILDGNVSFDIFIDITLSDDAKLMYYKNISK